MVDPSLKLRWAGNLAKRELSVLDNRKPTQPGRVFTFSPCEQARPS